MRRYYAAFVILLVLTLLALLAARLLVKRDDDPVVAIDSAVQVYHQQRDGGSEWLIRLHQSDQRSYWYSAGRHYRVRITRLGPQLFDLDIRVALEQGGSLFSWHIQNTVRLAESRTVVASLGQGGGGEVAGPAQRSGRIIIELAAP